jgi:hypothetical protein
VCVCMCVCARARARVFVWIRAIGERDSRYYGDGRCCCGKEPSAFLKEQLLAVVDKKNGS